MLQRACPSSFGSTGLAHADASAAFAGRTALDAPPLKREKKRACHQLTMTPARAERERLRAGALQRKLNEEKFTEFRLACGEGDGTACNSLGEWWATMRGDYARSMAIFADNCAANGHANSCFNAGLQMSAC